MSLTAQFQGLTLLDAKRLAQRLGLVLTMSPAQPGTVQVTIEHGRVVNAVQGPSWVEHINYAKQRNVWEPSYRALG